jgi:hypothetical protein
MRKTNLMLHCGAGQIDREKLSLVPTPMRTPTWVPIPHDRLLLGVLDTLTRNHMELVNEAHGVTRDGNRYFGLLQVANGQNSDDFGLVIGLRNSHDKSFPAGLVVGASVFVCDNLSFSGEVRLARKHTAHVERDLPSLITRAVGQLGELRNTQDRRFAAYKQTELSDGQAHDLLIQAIDARVLPVTKLPNALAEWRAPRHEEFRQGKTAWRLFNAFTEALKGHLDLLAARTQALHGLMDTTCGLILPKSQPKEIIDATIA